MSGSTAWQVADLPLVPAELSLHLHDTNKLALTINAAWDAAYVIDAVLYGIGWWRDGRSAAKEGLFTLLSLVGCDGD